MKAQLERELKLAPPADLDLSGIEGERLPVRVLDSTYWDTPARDLLRRRVTLRRRVEGDSAAWQLKLPAEEARHELELGDGEEQPPDEALRLLVALTRRAQLEPVAHLRTRRETVQVRRDGMHVADLVVDAVTVLDGDVAVGGFDELEVELVDGGERDLRRLGKTLRAAGAGDAPTDSKLARALGVVAPESPLPVESPPSAVLAAALRAQAERMVEHDPGTRTGIDAEDLHQLRVATRRLRAFLRAGHELVEAGWADDLRAEIGWLGGLLGAVRDHDVLSERLRAEAAELDDADRVSLEPLFDALAREREQARTELLAALDSDRYLELLRRLESEPPLTGAEPSLRSIWRKEVKRSRKAAAGLAAVPADDELHALRKRVKRARYAAELAAPELGKRGAAYVEAAKDVQDVLGDHQDAVVAEAVERRLAPGLPEAGLALGRLVERERARRAAARATWRDAWARLEKAAG